MYPFQPMAASYVAENAISDENQSEVVLLKASKLRDLTKPGQFLAVTCAKVAP